MSRIFDNVTENFNSVPEDLPVYEGYDAETGDVMAFTEAAADMVGIYEAMHAYGMAELQMETNPTDIAMEGLVDKAKNVFEKIKEQLKKLWAKIRSFFDNVIIAFNAKIKNGKEFAKKYEDRLKKLNLTGFKPETYSYAGLYANPVSNAYSKCTDVINKMVLGNSNDAEWSARKEEYVEQIRGVIIGDGRRYSSEEFATEAVKKFRGGLDKKEISINIQNVINTLKDEKALKAAKEAKTAMDKSFTDQIKAINDQEKSYESQIKDMKDRAQASGGSTPSQNANVSTGNAVINRCKHSAALFTDAQSICTTYFNKWKAVYDERIKEYKSICVQAFKHKAA